MPILHRLRQLLSGTRELDRELAAHADLLIAERLAAGDTPEQAARYARLHLGSPTRVAEQVADLHPASRLATAVTDLRHAARTLWRHRGAYAPAVAILALGIAMSVTIFSLVSAVLLRPLPYPESDRLAVITKRDLAARVPLVEMAYPELADLTAEQGLFTHVALHPTTLYGYGRVLDTGHGDPIQVESNPVSHDFFRVLGVAPRLGRDFTADDEHPGAAPVVILSDRVWREHFSADPTLLGRQIRVNGAAHTVIGVMPAAFDFPRGAGLWSPLGINAAREQRATTYLQAIVRLAPGRTFNEASTRLAALARRQSRDFPQFYTPTQEAVVTPLARYWAGSARVPLWLSLGASLLLLAAACVSAGNLVLSRALTRRREMATRAALGASAARLLGQFALEGALLAAAAAALGLALAQGGLTLLLRWAPADIPRLSDAAIDPPAVAFATLAAALCALLCSAGPAWLAHPRRLEALLRQGGQRSTAGPAGRRLQRVFLSAETAITVTLLTLSLLVALSYRRMLATDTGFAQPNAVTMNLAVRGPAVTPASRREFYTALLDRLSRTPGIDHAAAVLLRPFEGSIGWDVRYRFASAGELPRDAELPSANFEVATPGYFAAVGLRLLEGRDFDNRDTADGLPTAIVSESLARQIRRTGRSPLGERIRFGRGAGNDWRTVIGVAADARYRRVTESGDDIYIPYLQTNIPTNYVVAAGPLPPGELADAVRRAAASVDRGQAVAGVATLGELIQRDTARSRFEAWLLGLFAACALLLAAAGVYSVMTETVAARARELAVKSALGASRPRLLGDVLGGALSAIAAGAVLGAAGAYAAGHAAADLLYGVPPFDPALLTAVVGLLLALSLAAGIGPAWSAAGRDPRTVLQAD